ncbi:response regulator [Solimicrobium silvestre]|uniref:Response regulator containing a CheY-like receiver domain and an HTH DNA-binding domain n=1 Tax=Solimicrobium silvestre TaxID=2099400 RepID=A0A2S9H3I9_9BURK|nr:response regulator transcription factor [Solimicrobium silvestre]PRC94549.1 Response regulator containing a CheY-like receiver domain and an HTH DNA-binding domain [Solimicrobium silvestre]
MATKVAIIEDNVEFLNRFRQVIQSDSDFAFVGSASNGADGIALIDSIRADAYLVDLGLPDINGIELIKHAVKTYPECDVMVITMFADDAHVIKSIEAGATGYILKDSSSLDILDCIRTLRDGGSPISPMIARRILQRFQPVTINPAPVAENAPPIIPSSELLSEREYQVLHALSKGLSFKEIAAKYYISTHTVARHVKKIYRVLAVHSRGEAVYEATKLGILSA